ncbi:MAG: hypothetical protein PHC95_15975 [Parabacteroides sp.]|nr:hypothetical protein [Parabacteroides sp.]
MPELSFYERQHIQKILAQQGAIGNIYNAFAREISGYLRKWTDTGKPNVWVRNATIEKGIDKALLDLQTDLLNNLSDFGMDAWKRSQAKNDDIVKQYIRGMSISSVAKKGLFYRDLEALKAIQSRIDGGMNLSDKVWKIVEGTKAQVELYLGSGLSVGRPAGGISQDMRQLLHDPDKRFRRVRGKNGKIKLSKPMADYHPGQGVYRSSYMNALRLSSTETNINYRQADHDRWQKMDFVLGIEIKRSANNKGPCKVCDAMAGKYPKDFVFTGFHPFCICFAVPLMMDHEEFADYLLDDTIPSGKIVHRIPDMAKRFISDHYEMLRNTYVVRNNDSFFSENKPVYSKERFKEIKEKASSLKQSVIHNKGLSNDIMITGRGIKEWLNQPHKHYQQKNEMLLDISSVVEKAQYVGYGNDKHGSNAIIHLLETKVEGDESWIIVKEQADGSTTLYSISDSENILKILKEKGNL